MKIPVPHRARPKRKVSRLKPGPKTRLGGERFNFLPGQKLRDAMIDLKLEAARDFNIVLSQSYILREGALSQISHLKDLFKKARQGELGPKRREQFLQTIAKP